MSTEELQSHCGGQEVDAASKDLGLIEVPLCIDNSYQKSQVRLAELHTKPNCRFEFTVLPFPAAEVCFVFCFFSFFFSGLNLFLSLRKTL